MGSPDRVTTELGNLVDRRIKENLFRSTVLGVAAAGAAIGFAACRDSQAKTTTVDLTAPISSPKPAETPTPVITNTVDNSLHDKYEITQEKLNFQRKIENRNYWEFLGNENFRFEEVVDIYRTGDEGTLRKLGPAKRVFIRQIDNKTGETVKLITNRDDLFNAVFPMPKSPRFGYPSDRISPSDLNRARAFQLATNQDYVTELPGIMFGHVDGPSGTISFELGQRPFFHCDESGQNTAVGAQKITFVVNTAESPSKNADPFFKNAPVELGVVDDKFCVIQSR